jgi:hypothetical protein
MKSLEARAEAMRARLRVRAWETRQLQGSKGTWYRLSRMLARAREAYVIDESAMEELLREGYTQEPVGDELEPKRAYVFVPAERVASVASRHPIAVRLSADLLGAPKLMLVAFER